MDDTRKAKIKEFFDTYTAYFGRLGEADGGDYYQTWLENPGINIDKLLNLMHVIGESWDGKNKPRLGQLKRKYNQAIGIPEKIRPRKEGVACELCRDHGHAQIITAGKSPDSLQYVNRILHYRYINYRLFPCSCQRGRNFYDKQSEAFTSRFTFAQVQTAHDRSYCHYGMDSVHHFISECNKLEEVKS